MKVKGSVLAEHLKPNEIAVCSIGLYATYPIKMDEYGNLVWSDGQIVQMDGAFSQGIWEIKR